MCGFIFTEKRKRKGVQINCAVKSGEKEKDNKTVQKSISPKFALVEMKKKERKRKAKNKNVKVTWIF